MARKNGPSDEDYDSAARLSLLGLTAGKEADVDSIMETAQVAGQSRPVRARALDADLGHVAEGLEPGQ